jgi:hypothetical protein
MVRAVTVLLLLCGAAAMATAQALSLQPGNVDVHPQTPTVWFQRIWPDATPSHIIVVADASGHGLYASWNVKPASTNVKQRKPSIADASTWPTVDPDVKLDFTLSPENVKLIFASAERLRYFNGDFAFKKNVASTGVKTLTYADSIRHFSTTYNATEDRDVEAVTQLFTGISETLEYGERLKFRYRYDRLGLDQELTGMAEASKNGWLAEVRLVAPLLKSIANDPQVLHLARKKATQVLQKAGIAP